MPEHDRKSRGLIEGFIEEHVTRKGLDSRTEKAYRLDLEHFSKWLEQNDQKADHKAADNRASAAVGMKSGTDEEIPAAIHLEDQMEAYLDYLTEEKKLSSATVCRKNRVFGYYLSYLAKHGIIPRYRSLRPARRVNPQPQNRNQLSKKESDAFFAAIEREYEELDSEFRKRICLRDMVMMELLFYHRIEISELLRLEVSDYDQKMGVLTVRRKKGKDSEIYLFSRKLRGRMERWLAEREQIQGKDGADERIFLSKFGKPLSMKMVIKIFDKYRELAGIEKEFTPKDLKESCMKQYARDLVMEMCERGEY